MHTPTKQQWQTVIDNFVRVLPLAKLEKHLDMDEYIVYEKDFYECGTIHCVGGWYGISVNGTEYKESFVGFQHGADEMAIHLGFEDHIDLKTWAALNNDLWGNYIGEFMFSDACAYDGAKNLHEVIAFLEKVKDRSPE